MFIRPRVKSHLGVKNDHNVVPVVFITKWS
jgi:hypothetical protein